MIKKIMISILAVVFMGLIFVSAGMPSKNDTDYELAKKAVFRASIYGADRFPIKDPEIKDAVDIAREFTDEMLQGLGLSALRWDRANSSLRYAEERLKEHEKTN